jgi:hypothetical protein
MSRIRPEELTPENMNSRSSDNVEAGRKKRTYRKASTKSKPYVPPPPLLRSCVHTSPKKKLEIILYLLHHRIEEPEVREGLKQRTHCLEGLKWDGYWRPPTSKEAGIHFKVPDRTVRSIWKARHTILDRSRGSRKDASGVAGERHSKLELEPFQQFIDLR